MDTFALVLAIQITTSFGVTTDTAILDLGLPQDVCLERMAKAAPSIVLSDDHVLVTVSVACNVETPMITKGGRSASPS